MSTNVVMEGFVRPFQLSNIRPLSIGQRDAPPPPGVVACMLGGSGGRSVSFTYNESGTVIEESSRYKESGRTSTKVRVENENDPSQFVEFCRADQVKLTPTDRARQKQRTSSYDTSGGFHDLTGTQQPSGNGTKEYNFKYPSDQACTDPSKPPRGC